MRDPIIKPGSIGGKRTENAHLRRFDARLAALEAPH